MAPQYPVFLYPPDGVSPKPRDAVILLSFFLGIYGGHRFYLGKYGTAILMIFTLGGFGIWYLIDFFNAIFGTYKDSEGRFVDKHYTKALGVALIVILCVGALYMIFVWGLIMREIQSGSF
jgi:TM2 domain-containing membrane protein YozV